MNTPPPPPFHRYHSSPNSSYGAYTPNTESSFDRMSNYNGSDRHSDRPLFGALSTPTFMETRRPSLTEAELLGTGSSFNRAMSSSPAMDSTPKKNWLYFVYTRNGATWDEDIIVEEPPMSEAAIRKKAASKSERGSVDRQLPLMGPNRRSRIERHATLLSCMEPAGIVWEPVWMDNLQWKVVGLTSEVKVFEVIYARRQSREARNSSPLPPTMPFAPEVETIRAGTLAERTRSEKRNSRDYKAGRVSARGLEDDHFGSTEWFDVRSGAPNTGLGVSNLGSSGGSSPMSVGRSPVALKAKVVNGLDFDREVFMSGAIKNNEPVPGFNDPNKEAQEILRNLPKISKNNDNNNSGSSDSRQHSRHSSRDKRERRNTSSSSSSRPSFIDLRQKPESGLRNVRLSSHLGSNLDLPTSRASSAGSGDVGVMFDDVDEVISFTSGDTGSSSSRKVHRSGSSAHRHRRSDAVLPSSSGRYEVVSDSRSRRGTSHTVDKELSTGRDASPRSKPRGQRPSPLSEEVPPIVVYPDFFDNEAAQKSPTRVQNNVQGIDEYMSRTAREKREEEVEKREREMRERLAAQREEESQKRETLSLRSEMENMRLDQRPAVRKSVYNHEPRKAYDPATRGL